MKLSDLRSADEVREDDMAGDPEYRREYLETSFANQVAIQVIRWRTEHGLTQTKLADLLGMRQPNIARLEAGEHTPSLETLSRLASGLGIRFDIGIDPADGIRLDGLRPPGGTEILEIKHRTALDLDEPTYGVLRQKLAELVAGLGQRQSADAPEPRGGPVNVDAIFQDPGEGLIVFLEGFPGHTVNYLEVGSGSPGASPASASRAE